MAVLDTQGMFDVAGAFPEQVERAVAATKDIDGLPELEEIENVVVLGMGGSGIAGDVLSAVAAPLLPVPVIVAKGYECPAFIGDGSLVFAISCSGNTEETIQAASDAAIAGARMVVVTGGGELASLAGSWGAPIIDVPSDIPQPRAALGAMAIPPLVVLAEIGLFKGAKHWIDEAIEQLNRRRDQLAIPADASVAAEMAERIGSTLPLVQGGSAVGAVAAQRWKAQINENAKRPAFWSAQPELCHNEVCGWSAVEKELLSNFSVVTLRHDDEHPQLASRFQLTSEIVRQAGVQVLEVRAEGDGNLAQLLDLMYFGDYVSLWLAVQAGVDPGPVDVLVDLKRALAG